MINQATDLQDAQDLTAAQPVTFCVALSVETSPVVDHVGARERRGDAASVCALPPTRQRLGKSLARRGRPMRIVRQYFV